MSADPLAESLPDLGPYRPLKLLGVGGMGRVYLAERGEGGEKVAVKVLHDEMLAQPGAAERFALLGHAAMKLRHPNIVAIHDCGVLEGGAPFWVMEHLEGRELGQLMAEQGTLDYRRLLEIARPVCAALNAAHEAGLVHLDIKPSNVFLTRVDGKEVVKLVDFGIASMKGGTASRAADESILGAPEYWSPEQASGLEVDGRSDVYSLGVVLYEALTGQLPFRSHTFSDLVERHLYAEPLPISQVSSAPLPIPRAVKAVVMRCLAKDRSRRYQDALELDAALAEAVRAAELEAEEPALQLHPDGTTTPTAPARAPQPIAPKPGWLSQGARFALSFAGGFLAIAAISTLFRTTPAAIAFAFAPTTVPVLITSEPPGAYVYLEGNSNAQGRTPVVVRMRRSSEAVGVVVQFSPDSEMRTVVTPSHPTEVLVKMRRRD
jgi:serine/threonine protein kinase